MSDINGDELRARFSSLREHDERTAPEFSAMLDRARGSALDRAPAARLNVRWVAVAAGIVIAGVLLTAKARDLRKGQQSVVEIPTLSTWQSPTAGLLETQVQDLMAPPPLLSSVFDGVTPAFPQRQTDGVRETHNA